MRKIILPVVFLLGVLMLSQSLVAQDCKMCGDWIGTCSLDHEWDPVYKTMVKKTYRIFVRIKRVDENPIVRLKLIPTDGGETWYQDPCNIEAFTTNSIAWSVFIRDDSDWDENDRLNGIIIGSAKYYHYYEATYYSGYMHLTCKVVTKYYSRSGDYIDLDSGPIHINTNVYKDDEDW